MTRSNRIPAKWSTREARISWVMSVDRHACITDADLRAEYGRIATAVETWQAIAAILEVPVSSLF